MNNKHTMLSLLKTIRTVPLIHVFKRYMSEYKTIKDDIDEKYSIIKPIVVPSGEKLRILNSKGEYINYTGPCQKLIINSKYKLLKKVVATSEEYMIINYVNGEKDIKYGPYSCFLNSEEILTIDIHKGIRLESKYDKIIITEGFTKYIVNGPITYFPKTPNEKQTKCKQYIINQNNYCIISYRDGYEDVLGGPANILFDPLIMSTIKFYKSYYLASKQEGLLTVTRTGYKKWVYGPRYYYPEDPYEIIYECKNYIANNNQYLVITFKNGETKITKGPCNILFDTIDMVSIDIIKI